MNTAEKRRREQALVGEMITLYCRRQHKTDGLCPDCQALWLYAEARSRSCPRMETKTFCSGCKTHCYNPEMRRRIRAVMRFSGPRMVFRHPVVVTRHILDGRRKKKDEAATV